MTEKLNTFKITQPPPDFKFKEFVWREPIARRVSIPRTPFWMLSPEQKQAEYTLAVGGYKSSIVDDVHLDTKNAVDITVKTSPNNQEEQLIRVILHSNSLTRAKEDITIEKRFTLNTVYYLNAVEMLNDLRYMYLKEMLTH